MNVLFLHTQTILNTENLNKLTVNETLVEQALLFEITLNQYVYKTQNLIAIVNSAIQGEIFTSVFPTKKMITKLKEIKMSLPVGVELLWKSEQNLSQNFIKTRMFRFFTRTNI